MSSLNDTKNTPFFTGYLRKVLGNFFRDAHFDNIDKSSENAAKTDKSFFYSPSSYILQTKFPDNKIFCCQITKKYGFSPIEQRLLTFLPQVIHELVWPEKPSSFWQVTEKLCGRIALDDILAAYLLNAGDNSSVLNNPSLTILNLLQDLTFYRYEEQRCTSGFVFAQNPDQLVRHLDAQIFYYYIFPNRY